MDDRLAPDDTIGVAITTAEDVATVLSPSTVHTAYLPLASESTNRSQHSRVPSPEEVTRTSSNATTGEDDESTTSATSVPTLPPYELIAGSGPTPNEAIRSPRPLQPWEHPPAIDPRSATLSHRLSAPNMSGAFPVRIKATHVQHNDSSRTIRKIDELMLISPHMNLTDFQRTFAQKVAAHHSQSSDPANFFLKPGEELRMTVRATWKVRRFLGSGSRWLYATLQNWPDIVGGLKCRKLRRLEVEYWIIPATEANGRD